jgi:hypothetical protein
MHLTELLKLERAGGAVLERYRELLAQGDVSAHDSVAARELAEFQRDWCNDPAAVTAAAEARAAQGERA